MWYIYILKPVVDAVLKNEAKEENKEYPEQTCWREHLSLLAAQFMYEKVNKANIRSVLN